MRSINTVLLLLCIIYLLVKEITFYDSMYVIIMGHMMVIGHLSKKRIQQCHLYTLNVFNPAGDNTNTSNRLGLCLSFVLQNRCLRRMGL